MPGARSCASLLEQIAAATITPSRAAGRREVQAIVDDVLEKLPPLYARVLRLCDLEGKPGAEAATVLGRSHGAVRMLLARARECLKDALGAGSGLFSDGP